jgi:UDP-GlcNAc3NAcA epimerase
VPCITLRPETEWVETVEAGWNVVVGTQPENILRCVKEQEWPLSRPALFGDGQAAEKIVAHLAQEPLAS